ncbi:MAG: hypothetical protein GY913_27100 [Proteobacteria bacterium]|nr:hypothetical protein [Pseudomonadota bacterium]MCP4920583.1 hypothetical protein [Pseudomonadota bacterium]
MSRPPRHSLIPNANNVRILARLLELVAQGVREPRAIAEVLDCEVRTVHYYTQAGDWLSLLETDERTHRPFLTRLGMEYVYAGKNRPRVYAKAVWNNEFVRQMMDGRRVLPETAIIARFIQQAVPDMAESTARRRATAVRSLLEPAMRYPAPASPPDQLSLDLGLQSAPTPTEPPLDLSVGVEGSPDVYRVVLRALLDHGELSLWHIRALLDRAGGTECPVAPYVDLAIERGDAWRVGDRVVVSWGAVWRRELADTVAGVALSDPGYRAYLTLLRQAAAGDPGAAMDYIREKERYAAWDKRIFGVETRPDRLAADLDRVLLGRPIDAFPLAGETGPEPAPATGSFLGLSTDEGLVIALPPTLHELTRGVSGVNAELERARQGSGGRLPSHLDRRELVHGGLFHPGEPRGRAVADRITLRWRALSHVPHLTLVTALLVLHRKRRGTVQVFVRDAKLELKFGRRNLGDLLFLLDEFCSEQGWLVTRRPRAGLPGSSLAAVLEALGVAVQLDSLLVLDETFFVRLQADAEDRELYDHLLPLGDRLAAFLEEWRPEA